MSKEKHLPFALINEEKVSEKEKQIEEMAKILCGMKNGCDGCMWNKVYCNERNYAEEIYNAGYRKQEWISVDERLPDKYKSVLISCEDEVRIDCIDAYGLWHDNYPYRVTHWMPLPEAPKMKGGE